MYFQLMLPGVRDGEELVLMVDGQRHKVMKHTPETLEKAREKNAALAVMAQDRLKDVMYYAEVRKDGLGRGDGFDRRLHRLQVVSAGREWIYPAEDVSPLILYSSLPQGTFPGTRGP